MSTLAVKQAGNFIDRGFIKNRNALSTEIASIEKKVRQVIIDQYEFNRTMTRSIQLIHQYFIFSNGSNFIRP